MGDYILKYPDLLQSIQKAFNNSITTRYRQKDIQFKEIKAIYYVIRLWLQRLRGLQLMLYCDNDVYIYNFRKSSIRELVIILLRDIVMLLTKYDIYLVSIQILIKINKLVDNLSRFRYRKIANVYSQLRYILIASQSQGETYQISNIIRSHYYKRQLVFSNGIQSQRREKRILYLLSYIALITLLIEALLSFQRSLIHSLARSHILTRDELRLRLLRSI